jgi:hypothetical protein
MHDTPYLVSLKLTLTLPCETVGELETAKNQRENTRPVDSDSF